MYIPPHHKRLAEDLLNNAKDRETRSLKDVLILLATCCFRVPEENGLHRPGAGASDPHWHVPLSKFRSGRPSPRLLPCPEKALAACEPHRPRRDHSVGVIWTQPELAAGEVGCRARPRVAP